MDDDRRIDALVAEYVMGWKRLEVKDVSRDPDGDTLVTDIYLVSPEGRRVLIAFEWENREEVDYLPPHEATELPYFLACDESMQVQQRIWEMGKAEGYIDALLDVCGLGDAVSVFNSAIEIDVYELMGAHHKFSEDGYHVLWTLINATPKQRCLAALKVVGVEVEGS